MRGHTSSPLFQNDWYWICKHIKYVISLDCAKKSQEVLKFIVGVGVVNDHTDVLYALSTTTPTRLHEVKDLLANLKTCLLGAQVSDQPKKGSQNIVTPSLNGITVYI